MLEKNMGAVDRMSRIGLGLALIASAAVGPWPMGLYRSHSRDYGSPGQLPCV